MAAVQKSVGNGTIHIYELKREDTGNAGCLTVYSFEREPKTFPDKCRYRGCDAKYNDVINLPWQKETQMIVHTC